MKKIITVAAALLIAVAANAQTIWLNAGYQNASEKLTGTVLGLSGSNTENLNGFKLGGEYELGLANMFSVGLGLNLDAAFRSENDVKFSEFGLEIPVLARATVDLAGLKVFGHVGPDFKIGLTNQSKYEDDTVDYFEDVYNRFQFGALVGAGVIVADQYRVFVNYTIGLNNYAQAKDNVEAKNNTLSVGVSYKF